MPILKLAALSSFGLESIVSDELKERGYRPDAVIDGRVYFSGDYKSIADCNINLRCADRVVMSVVSFRAEDFGELYDRTRAFPWHEIIPADGIMHVIGKSVKSILHSVPDCQSIVKKAIVDSMREKYSLNRFAEDGPLYKIEISIKKDEAEITIDTSGDGLHKRGYRPFSSGAPLRETTAASIIRLSRWNINRVLADPFCGSGTIPIEAAMAARHIPPGLNREFAAEGWPQIPKKVWADAREQGRQGILNVKPEIFASDIEFRAVKNAGVNAAAAGVENDIIFQKKPVSEFSSSKKFGCMITNPPWGDRLGELREAEALYRELASKLPKLDSWSLFILSSHENFGKVFGTKPDKNRKLYNGKIKAYLNMYLGPLPPRPGREPAADE
jgi:putative N6-adenine-specific DNA methylase